MSAYCNSCQWIVHTEFSRNVDFHIKVHQSCHMVPNSKISRSWDVLHIDRTKICLLPKSKCLNFAGCTFKYIFEPLVIYISNSNFALFEQKSFTALIVLKIFMLIRSNMIFSKICEDSDIKHNPCGSVKHQSLRRNLHNHTVTSSFHHLCKILLNRVRLRCCIIRWNGLIPDNCLNRTNQSDFVSYFLQNSFYHISCCCLTLGTGNSNGLKLFSRISKVGCWHKCQCVSCIFYFDNCQSLWHFHIFFHNNRCSTFFCYIFYILMTVWNSTADAYEHTSRYDLSGIIDKFCNLYIITACDYLVIQTLQ